MSWSFPLTLASSLWIGTNNESAKVSSKYLLLRFLKRFKNYVRDEAKESKESHDSNQKFLLTAFEKSKLVKNYWIGYPPHLFNASSD